MIRMLCIFMLLPTPVMAGGTYVGVGVSDRAALYAEHNIGRINLNASADGERFQASAQYRLFTISEFSFLLGGGFVTQTTSHTDRTADWDDTTIEKSHDALALSVSLHHNSGFFIQYLRYDLDESYQFVKTEAVGGYTIDPYYGKVPNGEVITDRKTVEETIQRDLLMLGYRWQF